MNNKLLKYTSRDYDTIKTDLIDTINSVSSDWTSREDSDPGMLLINAMSSLGDNLSFNLDMQAQEMYLETVSQRKNIKKLLELVGYKVHWYRSGIVYVRVINNSDSQIVLDLDIRKEYNNNALVTNNGLIYTILPLNDTNKVVYIDGNQQSIPLKAVEGSIGMTNINYSDIVDNKFYLPVMTIDEDNLFLYEGDTGLEWTKVDDLALQQTSGRFFEFDVDEYDKPFIRFTSYWETLYNRDLNSSPMQLYYINSTGSQGCVSDDAFSTIVSEPRFVEENQTEAVRYTITNVSNQPGSTIGDNVPGYDKQSTEDARNDSKFYINTYNTLVTLSDFEKYVQQFDGFNTALSIDCQKAKELNTFIFESDDSDEVKLHKYVCGFVWQKVIPEDPNVIPDVYEYEYVDVSDDYIKTYNLNIYTIFSEFDQTYNSLSDSSAWNYPSEEFPYRRYQIDESVMYGNNNDGIVNHIENAKIMNVKVNFAECRVFDWRVLGTLFLKEPVRESEAETIIKIVIDALSAKFTANYVGFGNRISYIDVVEVIQGADSRIRYFDAGYGTQPLIDYASCFNVKDYFNPISILRFNQYSVPSISTEIAEYNHDEEGNQLIRVDSSCIISD